MAGYQILGIRSFFDEKTRKQKKYDAFFEQRWRVDNIADIFQRPLEILDQNKVPLNERYNLYYTISACKDSKRVFDTLEIIPFDVDGIDITRVEEYISPILEVIKAPDATVVFSGNGLHFLIRISPPFTEKKDHEDRRFQYRAILDKINSALEANRLPGKADPAVWDVARILRFPETLNIKPDKADLSKTVERRCFVLRQGSMQPRPFDWEKVSGTKTLDATQAIPKNQAKKYRTSNGEAAMEECLFLKHVSENAAAVDEPELYAALSIIGRFENGKELAQEIFKPRYGKRSNGGTSEAIAEKTIQAVAASGPRTCDNINNLWGKCASCPLYQKITSPVVILGKDVIPTEATGFWNQGGVNANGNPTAPTPNYDDLLRAFKRDYPYFLDQVTGRIYAFNGKKYIVFDDNGLMAWCEEKMEPKPKRNQRGEFAAKVFANNYLNSESSEKFFRKSILNKINLNNGIFDLETGELLAHTPEYGFTYVLPYDYSAEAKAPTFLSFLDDVTLHRKELQETLLDFMAYVFVHDYPDHCFLWLTGTGRNGKSTLTDLMELVVGAENATHILLDSFEERFQIETMNGKLLNVGEETEEKRIPKKQLSMLKAISAGAPTLVEAKGERPYTMRATAKLVFMANEAPKFGTANQAIKSRLLLVPFDKQLEGEGFSHIDSSLPERLAAELPGIFNLLTSRLREKLAKGPFRVHRNEISRAEVAELMREGDQLLAWVQDNCEVAEGLEVCGTALFDAYQMVIGEKYSGSRDSFSKRLRNLFPGKIEIIVTKNKHTKKAERRFSGISLLNSTSRQGVDF